MSQTRADNASHTSQRSPWPALWSMMIGFFVILVDSTIVSVAIPAIQDGLDADVNQVIWVNSSYLLAYAVPLLITGRLGDRFGPRTVYLLGLAVFTASSLWCGLAGSIESLIVARVFQGLGGALLTPQTMSVMIRIFSPTQRGAAMGVWGGVAGVATVVGPLVGGLLIDAAGWEWIFFVNVPVGIIGLVLAWIFVPRLNVTNSKFDWIGVLLSAIGMFCLIFAIQEGDNLGWEWRFWALIVAGLAFLALFISWQSRVGASALVPLRLFSDRNYSLACVAIAAVGMGISTFAIPWMIYIQTVQEYSPTNAALLLVPSGVISGVLSPIVGKQTNVHPPKPYAIAGLLITGISFGLIAFITNPDIDPRWLLAISALSGVGNAMVWGPLSMIATRNLPDELAGAGSSVYNTVRQVGAVIGSAAIAVLMSSQLASQMGDKASAGGGAGAVSGMGAGGGAGSLPEFLHEPFAAAMSHSLRLPAIALLLGAVFAFSFEKTRSWKD